MEEWEDAMDAKIERLQAEVDRLEGNYQQARPYVRRRPAEDTELLLEVCRRRQGFNVLTRSTSANCCR